MKEPKKIISKPAISVSIDDFSFLKNLIEKLSQRSAMNSMEAGYIMPGYSAIAVSSLEAYISGKIVFQESEKQQAKLYRDCFFFTCVAGADGRETLTWSSSLS